jgi:sodium-dependent dicarboxylate transporter 2/3/5
MAWIGYFTAVPLALVVYALLNANTDLPHQAKATAAIGTLIGILWITEALPLAVTSLLPLVLFPLAGVLTFKEAAAPYADNLVYVYFGGFFIALAIERWQLHRRIALHTLRLVGTRPAFLVGGLMLATALISMWISNTATTAMMLPLGLSLVKLISEQAKQHQTQGLEERDAANFATCMMLGIAYAATIGGLGTLIGTPTNTTFAAAARDYGLKVGFAEWSIFATPLATVYLLITWVLLTKFLFRLPSIHVEHGGDLIHRELASLGPPTRGEIVVTIIFLTTASLWLLREPLVNWKWLLERWPQVARLDDGVIALLGAIALFAIPIDAKRGVFALDWDTAKRMPWGVLLLFGGGLSLALAVTRSKLADWIGKQVELAATSDAAQWLIEHSPVPNVLPLLLVIVVSGTVIFASEFTSNVATVAAFLPIMYSISQGLDCDPLLLMVATTVAASYAFMLPVGTPPNAIAFGTGYIKQTQMMKAGLCLNLMGIVLIPIAVYTLGRWVLGIRG